MKKLFSTFIIAITCFGIITTSCVKNNIIITPDPEEYFDFATVSNYSFTLDYKLSYNIPILFFVYDEYPFKASVNDPTLEELNEAINPILKGMATDFGKYTGLLSLKKSVKQLYVYSPTIGVPQLLKSSFSNNSFLVDASNPTSFITSNVSVISNNSAANNSAAYNSAANNSANHNPLALNAQIPGYITLGSWNASSGAPDYLLTPSVAFTASFMNDINTALSEKKKIPITNPEYIANGVNAALHIIANAKVEVVFVHEGAGFLNVLGYYHYPTNTPPTKVSDITKIIAFPNASYPGGGGNLPGGSRVQLKYWNGSTLSDIFPPGVSIGWFINANGFKTDGTINQYTPHYYSLQQFNPESSALLKPHNVLLYDNSRGIVIVGFEDMSRENGADNDFNDAIFYAAATPETAIQYTNLPLLVKSNDADKDGIPDDRDEFPVDANVAYSTHYPSKDAYHSLAYEDLWPSRGDYDMNDVVVTYNSTHYMSANNLVVRVTDRIKPVWSGGGLDVGFGYQLGVSSASVSSVRVTSNFTDNSFRYSLSANGTEQGQSKATIMVYDNNTALGLKTGSKPSFDMDITFSSPVSLTTLTTPPYNPFIVINKSRGQEVHLPNYKPTDLADLKLLGTSNDKSNPAKNLYYVSNDQMPYAILIPGSFDIPTESTNIGIFYPRFLQWAKSFGKEYPDWYLYKK